MARRAWEIAGFLTIAAALHVSAAAIMLPKRPSAGAPPDELPAALSAGSGDLADLIDQWEAPPEVDISTGQSLFADIAEAAPVLATPDQPPALAAIKPPVQTNPDRSVAHPSLPAPPEAQPARTAPELPDLHRFDPPVIETDPALTLASSARPDPRPQRTTAEPQPKTTSKAEPAQKQPARQAAQPKPAAQGGGAAGTSARQSSGENGSGGISPGQRASLMARWQGQLSSCLLRSLARTSGAAGTRGSITFTIGRNGRVQGVRVTGSTGNPRVDREIARGAQRVRCPAAPAGLTEASYTFAQPFSIR